MPPALCAKGYFNPAMRAGLAGPGRGRLLPRAGADGSTVRLPPCLHAGIDRDTGHGLVVMEDLVEAGGTFLDPLARYGPEQAAATLDQLALLARRTGERARTHAAGVRAAARDARRHLPPDALQAQLDDGRAATCPPRSAGGRVQGAVRALAGLGRTRRASSTATSTPATSTSGRRPARAHRLAGGPARLWALDVAYHLAAVLDPDDRQRSERDLLDHYLDRLAAQGVTPPGRDGPGGSTGPTCPTGSSCGAITRMVDRPIIERHTRRLGLAVAATAAWTCSTF